jgi:hypothetical protein
VGGVVLMALLVTLLALQLAVLTDSRKHIKAQDAKITKLYEAAQPALDDAEPLVRQAGPFVEDLRAGLRSLRGSGPELAAAVDAVPPLLRATVAIADETLPLVRGLSGADVAHVVGHAHTTLDSAEAMLTQVRAQNLIEDAARSARLTPEIVRLQQRLLRVQLATLRTQRRSRRIQAETLEVQRQALVAIESIDRKTGGPVPAPTPPVP